MFYLFISSVATIKASISSALPFSIASTTIIKNIEYCRLSLLTGNSSSGRESSSSSSSSNESSIRGNTVDFLKTVCV